LPLPLQPAVQEYFILNAAVKETAGRLVVDVWEQMLNDLLDGTGQLVNALIDCLLVVYRGIHRESVFKASSESVPVHSHEDGEVEWVSKGCSTRGVDQDWCAEWGVRNLY
jgi:hypothetical protein